MGVKHKKGVIQNPPTWIIIWIVLIYPIWRWILHPLQIYRNLSLMWRIILLLTSPALVTVIFVIVALVIISKLNKNRK